MLKSSDELLDLKVADIACGSGAFLVAAARYLAERVVEAWTIEVPANAGRHDLYLRAVRQVVANSLYGADINDMAVEMCKLSLWLVSLDRNLPFSFVDDKVFLGNSLLGLTHLDQLRKLHIDRRATLEKLDYLDVDMDATIRKAVGLRERLATEIDEDDPARNSAAKNRQLAELHRVTAHLRRIANGVIAAGLPLGGKPGKALDEAYVNLRLAAKKAYPGPNDGEPNSTWLDGVIDRGLTPTVRTDYERWQPLHWVLEAPDVMIECGGFDAIVGNPPFLGGQKLTGAMGTDARDWLVEVLAGGARGSADLVAYFFLRAAALLGSNGSLGLVATNSVAQGVTREVGLDQLVTGGGLEITRAVKSERWPSQTANLEYSAVWATGEAMVDGVPRIVDGEAVGAISTLLEPLGRVGGPPVPLRENSALSFQGCIVLGMGFVVAEDDVACWIEDDEANHDVLFPYLGGEDVSDSASQDPSRWVIDFYDRTQADAAKYRGPFERVAERVRPERQKQKRKALRDRWWQFGEKRPAMREAITGLESVLLIVLHSKTVMPVRVPTGYIPSHALGVFAIGTYADQAVLSSSAHQMWAITYGSTLESRVRYTASDVFETFSRPEATDTLEQIGRSLDDQRREIMRRRDLGLTKLYNLVNDPSVPDADPDVARVRNIHVELDQAVMDAYGWSDILLDHGFHTYRQMERWTVSPAARLEILDRLLEENHRRAAAEVAAGVSAGKGSKTRHDSGSMF